MKHFIVIVFAILPLSLWAQEQISFKDGENNSIEFEISKNTFFIKHQTAKKQRIKDNVKDFISISETKALVTIITKSTQFEENAKTLNSNFNKNEIDILPVLVYKDGIKQVCDNEISIKLTENIPLNQLFSEYKFTVSPDNFTENQYLVKFENVNFRQIFDLVNQLQNHSKIEYIEPHFMRFLQPLTNDPFYNSQWSINNQAYLGGTIDVDMDVDEAWQSSTGQGINVAIIDEGVDLSHPDLVGNLISGFDATGNNSNGAPNENNNDAHGTSCAGIVAGAANNGVGIAGIAYNSKIIPIRIAYSNGYPLGSPYRAWITNDNWIASGINWAVQNGADILSNSWGGGSPSSTITNAINNAVNNGRGGKGCVVLFASGNNNSSVSFPATLDNVIAVGAGSMCDERKSPSSCDGENWWGSNYGNEIDVIAPGVKIYTTDISGSAGYDSGDYKADFNGTSSACPNAAGVAALVLSLNPNLSQLEVREILQKSTDKPSGYSYSNKIYGTWNNQVGYGRLNANRAVLSAISISISGSTTVCSGNSTFTIQNRPPNTTISWTRSSNLAYVSGQGTDNYTVRAIRSGNGWVQASVNGVTFRKNVWVGKPATPKTNPSGYPTISMQVETFFNVAITEMKGASSSMPPVWTASGSIAIDHTTPNGCTYHAYTTGTGNFYVKTRNICGYSPSGGGTVSVYSGGGGGDDGLLRPLSVSPNPANDYIEAYIENLTEEEQLDNEKLHIKIVNSKSIPVYNGTTQQKKFQINTSSLPVGTYYLLVQYKNQKYSATILISR